LENIEELTKWQQAVAKTGFFAMKASLLKGFIIEGRDQID